jgi:hypothetical protein
MRTLASAAGASWVVAQVLCDVFALQDGPSDVVRTHVVENYNRVKRRGRRRSNLQNMNKQLGFLWVCGLLLTVCSSLAAVQQAPPAGLYGQVTSAAAPVSRCNGSGLSSGELTQAASTTTGPDGRYLITKLVQGVYRIEFSLPGYEKVTRFGIVVFQDVAQRLDAVLQRADASSAPAAGTESGALRSGEVAVRLETSFGSIVLAVDTAHAPVTAANF